jgi:hypothetical protein
MIVTYPGDTYQKTANSPSDGSLRKCANYIFLVSNMSKTGTLGHLQIYPYDIKLLKGASTTLSVGAMDTSYYGMAAPSDVVYESDELTAGTDGSTLTGKSGEIRP